MRLAAAPLRALDPQLPRSVWLLQAGGLANALGSGLAFPFVAIYLHNVRGMSLGLVGGILAAQGLAQTAGSLLAGPVVDRIGARATLPLALLLQAVAWALFPLVHEPWAAVCLMVLDGLGAAAYWPAQSVLLTRLTGPARRHSAFAMQRVTMNLGIGLGALVGGLVANAAHPRTFAVLFLADAATFVVFAGVVLAVREARGAAGGGRTAAEAATEAATAGAGAATGQAAPRPPGYRDLLRDRPFALVFVLNAFLVATGYALLSLVMPFGKDEAGISERAIGLIWLVNTLVVVALQLPVSRLAEGRRRMKLLVGLGAAWAAAWLLVAAGGAWFEAGAATAMLALAMGAFAVGECVHGAVYGPLVADLAPRALQGRYFAVSSTSWGLGMLLGPAIGGVVLDASAFALWPAAAAASLLIGVVALRVEPSLPAAARRTPGRVRGRRARGPG